MHAITNIFIIVLNYKRILFVLYCLACFTSFFDTFPSKSCGNYIWRFWTFVYFQNWVFWNSIHFAYQKCKNSCKYVFLLKYLLTLFHSSLNQQIFTRTYKISLSRYCYHQWIITVTWTPYIVRFSDVHSWKSTSRTIPPMCSKKWSSIILCKNEHKFLKNLKNLNWITLTFLWHACSNYIKCLNIITPNVCCL